MSGVSTAVMATKSKATKSKASKGAGHAKNVSPTSLAIVRSETDTVITDPVDTTNPNTNLFPFAIEDKTYCFLSPLMSIEEGKEVKDFFPSSEGRETLFEKNLYIEPFVKKKSFPNDPKVFLSKLNTCKHWFDRISPFKIDFWKIRNLYNLMLLSIQGIKVYPWMIGAMMSFWSTNTNCLHLPCGTVGITLYDVAVITGLPPTGPLITPDLQPEKEYKVDFRSTAFGEFITNNMGAPGTPVTEEEHVAFLCFWLSAIIFCSSSVTVEKLYLPLAGLIHESKQLPCLSKLILSTLYHDIEDMLDTLREGFSPTIEGPIWLAQLWLNAMFEKFMVLKGPYLNYIEGFRLSKLEPRFIDSDSLTDKFWAIFQKFYEAKYFENPVINFAPFADRGRNTHWFRSIRYETSHFNERTQESCNDRWRQFTSIQALPAGFPQSSKDPYSVVLYAPNLMARQMGFAQAIPAPISKLEEDQVHRLPSDSLNELMCIILQNEDRLQQYSPFEHEPCNFVTNSFWSWWYTYFKKLVRPFGQLVDHATKLLEVELPKPPRVSSKRKPEPQTTPKKKKLKISMQEVPSTSIPKPPPQSSPTAEAYLESNSKKVHSNPSPSKSNDPSGSTHQRGKNVEVAKPQSSTARNKSSSRKIAVKGTPHDPSSKHTVARPSDNEKISSVVSSFPESLIEKSVQYAEEEEGLNSPEDTTSPQKPYQELQIQTSLIYDLAAQKDSPIKEGPNSPASSSSSLSDLDNLFEKLSKASSGTIIVDAVHADSVNKSVQLETSKPPPQGVRTTEEASNVDASNQKFTFPPEVVQAVRWLKEMLGNPSEDPLDTSLMVQNVAIVSECLARPPFNIGMAVLVATITPNMECIVTGRNNLRKCLKDIANLEKETKKLTKSESKIQQRRSRFDEQIKIAKGKLSALDQRELKLQAEIASLQQKLFETQAIKKTLKEPLDQAEQAVVKLDQKFTKIINEKGEKEKAMSEAIKLKEKEVDMSRKVAQEMEKMKTFLEELLDKHG